jgi:hypothetical protein
MTQYLIKRTCTNVIANLNRAEYKKSIKRNVAGVRLTGFVINIENGVCYYVNGEYFDTV